LREQEEDNFAEALRNKTTWAKWYHNEGFGVMPEAFLPATLQRGVRLLCHCCVFLCDIYLVHECPLYSVYLLLHCYVCSLRFNRLYVDQGLSSCTAQKHHFVPFAHYSLCHVSTHRLVFLFGIDNNYLIAELWDQLYLVYLIGFDGSQNW